MKTQPVTYDSGEPAFQHGPMLTDYTPKSEGHTEKLFREVDNAYQTWKIRRGIVQHGFRNQKQRGVA